MDFGVSQPTNATYPIQKISTHVGSLGCWLSVEVIVGFQFSFFLPPLQMYADQNIKKFETFSSIVTRYNKV